MPCSATALDSDLAQLIKATRMVLERTRLSCGCFVVSEDTLIISTPLLPAHVFKSQIGRKNDILEK